MMKDIDFQYVIHLTEKVMKQIKQKNVDDVVLHSGIERNHQTKFANNKIVKTDVSSGYYISVFCSINKRIVETTIKDLKEENIEKTINDIIRYSQHLPENKNFEGIANGPFRYKKLKHDKKIIDAEEKAGEIIEESINSACEKKETRNSGVFETSLSENYLLTSNNAEGESIDTNVYFSIRSIYEKDSSGHKVYGARFLKGLDAEELGRKAGEFAIDSKDPKEIENGRYDIIMEPLPLAIIIESIGHASSAFEVETGESFLRGKLGKRVGSEEFTLIDDPMLEDAYDSSECDAEGVPTKTKEIVSKGVLKTYLHNTSTAKRWNTVTTGNAGLISPHPWNLVVKKGKYKTEKMIKEIKRGIWVTNAWYMRFHNTLTGEFSIIPRDAAFYIENGKIKYSVKNIRINSTLEEIMKNTAMVGKDQEKIHSWEVEGSVITPSVLLKNIKITKPVG
jgi:PmbA protein